MDNLADAIKSLIKVERVSEEPVEKCQYCGKPLYRVQLFKKSDGQWIPIAPPFIEDCDCEDAIKEREERQRQQVFDEIRKNKIENLLKKSGLGKRFLQKTLANWNKGLTPTTAHAYHTVQEYVMHWWDNYKAGKGLYIHGPYGTGKTHLAAAVANYVIRKYEVPVLFGTITTLFQRIKDAIMMEDTHQLMIERSLLHDIDLLIIDDLGKERPTDWVVEELFTLINHRYERLKPIIITSNYTLEEIKRKYDKWSRDYGEKDIGSAIVSRLKEMCTIVPLYGKDYREGGVKND